jgi:murein DD-endopeptidase MepM/ murein hydrolase activator NlpD
MEGMMNKRKNVIQNGIPKEKISIIAASVFVLSALTLTGVYLASGSDIENEENSIDFAKLEQENGGGEISEIELGANNDMDADPDAIEYSAEPLMEANSGTVLNEKPVTSSDAPKTTESLAGTDKAAVFMEEESTLSFSGEDGLVLPIVGEVLLDYSMDEAVYHGTMQQYRYSPALVVAADEGATVTAAVDARVTKVYNDLQTGNTICFDLGNGYELTYGQLKDITLEAGDMVSAGDIVGCVASPSIYYTEEGTNIYYSLTKNGEPIDPLFR